MAKACSAASGLANTYVELRKTAGRAEPNERLGSKPRVRTAVRGRTSSCSGIKPPSSSVARVRTTTRWCFAISHVFVYNCFSFKQRTAHDGIEPDANRLDGDRALFRSAAVRGLVGGAQGQGLHDRLFPGRPQPGMVDHRRLHLRFQY